MGRTQKRLQVALENKWQRRKGQPGAITHIFWKTDDIHYRTLCGKMYRDAEYELVDDEIKRIDLELVASTNAGSHCRMCEKAACSLVKNAGT